MGLVKSTIQNQLFLLGVFARLLLVVSVEPTAAQIYYIPFIDAGVSEFSLNPWAGWKSSGGDGIAFPYGMMMYLVFAPAFFVGDLILLPPNISYFFTIFVMEFLLLLGLQKAVPRSRALVIVLFWLSPVNLIALYIYGFNDIIPVTLLFWSVRFLHNHNWAFAGAYLAAAISAKLSMVIALPVFLLYFFRNNNKRRCIGPFGYSFTTVSILLNGVYAFSSGALFMLVNNPEVSKISALSVELSQRSLMLVPFIYSLFLYRLWRLGRIDLENINALLALSFLFFALVFLDTPGWLLWSVPFLVIYQVRHQALSLILVSAFIIAFVVQVLFNDFAVARYGLASGTGGWFSSGSLDFHLFDSLLLGLVLSLGVIVGMRIWRQSVVESDFHVATRQPFVVAIAGDSGAGKDTVADALIAVTGTGSSINISGDDYHKYDRGKGVWNAVTHLNPVANNLDKFAADIQKLKLGKPIRKRHYNHGNGKLGRLEVVSAKDFIIASGLHSFSNAKLQALADITIYLDMNDKLRRYLKVRRDVNIRKKDLMETQQAIEKRSADFERYVVPQKRNAQIIIGLNTNQNLALDEDLDPQKLVLNIEISGGLEMAETLRLLAGICQCQVSPKSSSNDNYISYFVAGNPAASHIKLAAKSLSFDKNEIFAITPEWHGGMIGVIQLICLAAIMSNLNPAEKNENL